VAFGKAAVRTNSTEWFGRQIASEGVGGQKLQTMTETLAETGGQAVIPVRSLRFGLDKVGVGPAEQKRTQIDVGQCVIDLATYGVFGGGCKRLIRSALADQVSAPGADIAHFQYEITRQLRLHIQAVALKNGWPEVLGKSGRTLGNCSRRIGRKRGQNRHARRKRVGKGSSSVVKSLELPQQAEWLIEQKLNQRLPGHALMIDTVAATQNDATRRRNLPGKPDTRIPRVLPIAAIAEIIVDLRDAGGQRAMVILGNDEAIQ